MNTAISTNTISRGRVVAFWLTTGIIALETAVGSAWDLGKTPFVRTVFEQLGYPEYVLYIMGVWKILGVMALLAPRLPRLKEWVYAGLFFIYSGAFASHLAVGQGPEAVGPFIFSLLTLASWALRPAPRRDFGPLFQVNIRSWQRTTIYWITTALVVFQLGTGGIADLLRPAAVVEGMTHLGYPVYFCVILGAWKVLGAMAVIVPRLPRLKEWAYAGAIFDLTGAAASDLFVGEPVSKLTGPLLFALFALISWALRPASRRDLAY
jgi:uncharacterized membrane protein YphA (DoxX/SURF4 family)